MNETPASRFLRQPGESSLPFNLASLSQSLLSNNSDQLSSSTSPSEYESTSPSLVSYSSSGSPNSSLASSPALRPKLLPALSTTTDELSPLSPCTSRSDSITTQHLPTSTDLSLYAASIIRNEAYALLSLAARLSPASQPIVSDEELDSASNSESSSYEGLGFDEDTHPSRRESVSGPSGVPILQESRTNVAFRQVVNLIRDMPAHGKVLVTGIGKSGIAGKKMVATFCSLGKFLRFIPLSSKIIANSRSRTILQEFKLHSFTQLKLYMEISVQSVTVQATPRLRLLPATFSSSSPTLAQLPNSCDSYPSFDLEYDPSLPSPEIPIQS